MRKKQKDLAIKIDGNALAFITHRLLKFSVPNKALPLNTIQRVALIPPFPIISPLLNAGHIFIFDSFLSI